MRRWSWLPVVAALLAACGTAVPVTTPDPAAIPTGPLRAEGPEATGPIVELASATVSGIGWRYAIYPSAEGWCTQLQTAEVTSTGCGDPVPAAGETFGSVARVDGELGAVEGTVTTEVTTVWLVAEDGGIRVPALLMPLDEVGLEAQAFIGFTPEGVTITHLQAVKINGEVLDTVEIGP